MLADLKATTALAALGVAAAAGLVVDRSRRLPTWTRQVDERWLSTYRGWVYGLGYGVQLGAGVVTIVPASVIYLMLVAAALTGSPAHGAVIGAVFGFTRALPLPLTARVQTPAALRRTLAAMQRGNLWAVRGVVVGQGLVAAGRPRRCGRRRRKDRVMQLSAHGLRVRLPAGWEGAVSQPLVDDGMRLAATAAGTTLATPPVMHLGNFPLPAGRGDFGSGAVEVMGRGGAFVALVEYGPENLGTPLFADPLPRRVRPRQFRSNSLQRALPGQVGFQVFGHASGRAWCLYVVLGSSGRVRALVDEVNAVLDGLEVGSQ